MVISIAYDLCDWPSKALFIKCFVIGIEHLNKHDDSIQVFANSVTTTPGWTEKLRILGWRGNFLKNKISKKWIRKL